MLDQSDWRSAKPNRRWRYRCHRTQGRAEKVDTRWAALLQVSLPAEYLCIGVSRKDGNPLACAVHLEPKITAEKISLLQPDEYVTVIASKWDWMLVDGTRSGMNVHGWVHAGAGQAKYLRPIPPQEFPWQRARGTGVYSNVLAHRKSELRELDLAEDPGLLREVRAVATRPPARLPSFTPSFAPAGGTAALRVLTCAFDVTCESFSGWRSSPISTWRCEYVRKSTQEAVHCGPRCRPGAFAIRELHSL